MRATNHFFVGIAWRPVAKLLLRGSLVDLLLFVNAELAGATVDQQQEATNDGQDLEEIVFGKVLVRVVLVKLAMRVSTRESCLAGETGYLEINVQSRNC
jgi:hypothetical protein